MSENGELKSRELSMFAMSKSLDKKRRDVWWVWPLYSVVGSFKPFGTQE